jgi:hypothetical protein
MYLIGEFEPGALVDVKLTMCPTIDAPIMKGILKRYCRVSGWQSVLERNNEGIIPKHYPVKLAVIEVLSTGDMVRVDARGIIGLTLNTMEV